MTNALDAAGCARVVNGIVDIGAYELGMGRTVTITAEAGPHGSIQPSGGGPGALWRARGVCPGAGCGA